MTPSTAQQQAKAAAGKHPDAWIAVDEGDTLEGEIVDVTFAWSDQRGGEYPLLTVRQADGTEKKLHCFSTVLYNEAMRQRPMTGERIIVSYLGIGEPRVRGQNGAKRYSFRIEGRGREAIDAMYDRASAQQHSKAQEPAQAPPPDQAATGDEDIPF